MTQHDLHGVRIEPDGSQSDVAVPASEPMLRYCERQLGGWTETGRYGTPESVIIAVVHETSARDGQVNGAATAFVNQIRGGQLTYWLHGTVFFFGFDPHSGDTIDLTAEQRTILATLPAPTGGVR
ncbi:DUF3846 domain-containing protein [Streptomyces sp. NPDC057717]|uniref:DUF3846 domain-containing protein n=1 Tax=Streptomyces sp. NPDC057717 TaxID=3346224 RepID=UPI0036C9C930